MKKFFKFGIIKNPRQKAILQIAGIFIFLLIWQFLCEIHIVNTLILPSPIGILGGFFDLIDENNLAKNWIYSTVINITAFVIAVVLGLIAGYIFALFGIARELFSTLLTAGRYTPATALIPAFMLIFNVESIWLKVFWLAFAIWIYLVPALITRVDEINQQNPEYLQTLKTLGANQWTQFIKLYWSGVLPRFSDDVKNLVAISWTYITAIELIANTGGLGSLMFVSQRATRPDKVYALIIIIIITGLIQDILFKLIDKKLFKSKYL
jgi:NitT/TauT family transport system permease protein